VSDNKAADKVRDETGDGTADKAGEDARGDQGGDRRRRQPAPDRARKRAIRAHAARTGVPYSVAARLLDGDAHTQGIEPNAGTGRTAYPVGTDEHRRWLIDSWQRRPFELRVRDARQAADLPLGRAEHLVLRFPATRGEPGSGVGRLYHGESRAAAIGMLYAVVGHERPELAPSAAELAWSAELGEDGAVDVACAAVDRAARQLLGMDRWRLWPRVEAALDAAAARASRPLRDAARAIGAELRTLALMSSVDGARHTLDAVLVSGEGGHAPGTRVHLRARPHRGRPATIVGAHWAAAGPPSAYDVVPDGGTPVVLASPRELTLPGEVTEPTGRPTPV
jgi:hypothetical protein